MLIKPDLGRPTLERGAGPSKEMLSIRRDENGKLHIKINYSSLSIILTCMKKAQLSLHRQVKSKVESPATLYGKAIHKALEVFYREPRQNRNLPPNFEKQADLLLGDFFNDVNSQEPDHFILKAIWQFLLEAQPLHMLPESDKRSLSAGVWTLCHYFKTYIDDPFMVYEDENGPITERTCEAVLFDNDKMKVVFFGTIDVILRNDKTNVILPADHKTFSSAPSDFYKRIKPNHQYTGYIYLAREALGLNVDTFLANGIQVKPRPTTARGTPPNFPRQPTRRTAEDIEDFKDAVMWAVLRYVDAVEETGTWPMGDVNACAMYNGCQFQQICEVPRNIQENVIEANYIEGAKSAESSRN